MTKVKMIGYSLFTIFFGVASTINIVFNFTLPICDRNMQKPNDLEDTATCEMTVPLPPLPPFKPTKREEDDESQTEKVDEDEKS